MAGGQSVLSHSEHIVTIMKPRGLSDYMNFKLQAHAKIFRKGRGRSVIMLMKRSRNSLLNTLSTYHYHAKSLTMYLFFCFVFLFPPCCLSAQAFDPAYIIVLTDITSSATGFTRQWTEKISTTSFLVPTKPNHYYKLSIMISTSAGGGIPTSVKFTANLRKLSIST